MRWKEKSLILRLEDFFWGGGINIAASASCASLMELNRLLERSL